MPKVIELTVELNVQRVSCPGVWLCQDGRVALTIFALGTSYQTCMLPPMFPLMFKDVFYFRKRFEESCALNNICCLLKEETIYCELVQFCDDCHASECTILAQYLGSLNDVLFPSNMCSNEGVDLLMRRSKGFPGILSPKIEIATKVRIDELWDQTVVTNKSMKIKACSCKRTDLDGARQKQVCHTPMYHRIRCTKKTRSRSRSRSIGSISCCSLSENDADVNISCVCPNPAKSRINVCPDTAPSSPTRRPYASRNSASYAVYNVRTPPIDSVWRDIAYNSESSQHDYDIRSIESEMNDFKQTDKAKKLLLESQYIEQDGHSEDRLKHKRKKYNWFKIKPCVCEICKRYHELFHSNRSKS